VIIRHFMNVHDIRGKFISRECHAMNKWVRVGVAIAVIAQVSLATVRRVPSEYPTIQEAVDTCEDGDTVLVASGIYSGPGNALVIVRKSITLRSEQGPSNCIIDCQGELGSPAGFGVVFGVSSVLDGFTITNGYGGGINPGAITCGSDGTEIRNCIITGNTPQRCIKYASK
jgi:hypothetical protein